MVYQDVQFEQSLCCSSTMSFISNTVPLVPYKDNDDNVDVDVGGASALTPLAVSQFTS